MKSILLLGAMLAALLNVTGALAYDTTDAGGIGGGQFREECAEGSVLTRIQVDSGKDLNVVKPVCAKMQNGQILKGLQRLHAHGTAAEDFDADDAIGDAMPSPACHDNSAVSAIHVRLSRHRTVHAFSMTCRDVATGEEHNSTLSPTKGGEAIEKQSVSCNPGDVAVGLRGAAGALINSLGLICAPIPKPAVEQPPKAEQAKKKPKGPANNPGKPAAVDNSGQGGEAARANTDTTIYDRSGGSDVGYLSDGDRVTIVQCRSDWCEISEPMQGWVWGPDLDR